MSEGNKTVKQKINPSKLLKKMERLEKKFETASRFLDEKALWVSGGFLGSILIMIDKISGTDIIFLYWGAGLLSLSVFIILFGIYILSKLYQEFYDTLYQWKKDGIITYKNRDKQEYWLICYQKILKVSNALGLTLTVIGSILLIKFYYSQIQEMISDDKEIQIQQIDESMQNKAVIGKIDLETEIEDIVDEGGEEVNGENAK